VESNLYGVRVNDVDIPVERTCFGQGTHIAAFACADAAAARERKP
jgi:hypothetical protein